MSRIGVDKLDQVEGTNQEWFTLKNNGDTARVQFILDKYEDIQVYMAHSVQPKGAKYPIKVDCLREYDEPLSKCPLCEAGFHTSAVKFIGLYDRADKKVKIWERGTRFIKALQQYCERYNPLRNFVFDIQRNGAAGSKDTTYQIFPIPNEQADDIGELTFNPLGIGIRQWSTEEMKKFVETGEGPTSGNETESNDSIPVPRQRTIPAQEGEYSEVF